MHRLRSLLVLALATPWAVAQQIVWAEGVTAQARDVYALPESNLAAVPSVVLANCQLLPIEISCRTLQQSLRDDVARRLVRQGLARVVLPDGGSLFRYRRAQGSAWGFLHLAADGTPGIVLERAGIGLAGVDDPFADRIGIAPDGRTALVVLATGAAAIVRLDGGVFASTGTPARLVQVAREFDAVSVAVGARVVWLMSNDDRVWRCDIADGAQPVEVTPSFTGSARTKPEFAPARDGRSVAFLFGPRPDYRIYVVGEQGPSLQLPAPLAKYEEPGYLPEVANGPLLLLDDDGSQLLYVDATSRDEVYISDVAGLRSTTQWTGDPNFEPYIGVIVLPFAINQAFVAGIGDPGLFDLYVAASGVPLTQNLTLTAGNFTRPYYAGGILPSAITSFRDGTILATFAPSAGGLDQAWQFPPAGPLRRAVELDSAIQRGAPAGGGGAGDLLLPSAAGDVLLSGVDGSPILSAPAGVRLSTSVIGPGGAYRAFLAGVAGARAVFLEVPGAGLVGVQSNGIDDVVLTPGGSMVLDDPSGLLIVGLAGSRSIQNNAVDRLVLSGQGTNGL